MRNFKTEQPYWHIYYYGVALKTDKWWFNDELLDSLETITDKQLQLFINDVYLSKVFIESLIMGNLTAEGNCLHKNKNPTHVLLAFGLKLILKVL